MILPMLSFVQRLEHNDLIETVQKLRSEMSTKFIHDRFLTSRIDITILINALQQMLIRGSMS